MVSWLGTRTWRFDGNSYNNGGTVTGITTFNDPRYQSRITAAELRGLTRIEEALKTFGVEFPEFQDVEEQE